MQKTKVVNPLRKITSGTADGKDILECGHIKPAAKDLYGPVDRVARHCGKCGQGLPPDDIEAHNNAVWDARNLQHGKDVQTELNKLVVELADAGVSAATWSDIKFLFENNIGTWVMMDTVFYVQTHLEEVQARIDEVNKTRILVKVSALHKES